MLTKPKRVEGVDEAAHITCDPKGVTRPPQNQPAHTPQVSNDGTTEDFVTATIKLIPLYGAYLFLSGWASSDYYYRFFGMDPKSLDMGLYDTLLRGFTVLFPLPQFSLSWLLRGAGTLWFLYGAVVVGSLIAQRWSWFERQWFARPLVVAMLLLLFLCVYNVSRRAGEERARLDTSDHTTLPTILFQVRGSEAGTSYYGKLLLLRNGVYFIHDVAPVGETPTAVLQVSVYRAEDLEDVSVVEHK